MNRLNTYCKGCDQFSAPHRRRDDGQWVCEDCGHMVKCSDPQWSENCEGELKTAHEVKKGLCEGCMAVIDSWSNDSREVSGSEQTKLMTDGGIDPIDESDRCDECEGLPELVEEAAENPLTGDEWDRYKCNCGHTTVRVPA